MSSRALVFVLDLVDETDAIAQYEAFHAPGAVWPEVIDDIRAQGVESMEIWRAGDRLVMTVTVAAGYPRQRPASAKVAEWEALMGRFQRRIPAAASGEKWAPARKIFDLASQYGASDDRDAPPRDR
jgi:L-rhamnose mutarotase